MNLVKLLLDTYLFQDLSPAELEPLVRIATVRNYTKDQAVFRTGDVAKHLFVVAEGRVVYSHQSEAGMEVHAQEHGQGGIFGEPALVVPERIRVADAIVLVDSVVVVLPRDPLIDFLMKHPLALYRLASGLAALVRENAQMLMELAFDEVEDRLAWILVELAQTSGHVDGEAVRLNFDQAELARRVYASRENVNRALQSLAEEGLVSLSRGRVVLLRVEDLRARAERGWLRVTSKEKLTKLSVEARTGAGR
jgi:CRP-like cAMP-binding protein